MKKDERILFTSESVSEGHPDKVCDQIADAILDAVLKEDSKAYVACECFATTQFLLIGGEITTVSHVNYEEIARNVIKEIGYDKDELGFNYKTLKILNMIHEQSPDIRQGVQNKNILLEGAGDQGIMFGYASNESKGFMPLPITIAHKLVRVASSLRKSGEFKHARPDMKSQVTIDYYQNPLRIDTILMFSSHDQILTKKNLKNLFKKYIEKSFWRFLV